MLSVSRIYGVEFVEGNLTRMKMGMKRMKMGMKMGMKMMMVVMVVVAASATATTSGHAKMTESGSFADKVDVPSAPANSPAFTTWAGYAMVEIPDGVGPAAMHFIYAEASGVDPSTAPVVLALSGGPGCSSEIMWGMENGPWNVGTEGKTLEVNEYAWNKVANMIYLDSPQSVGWSVSLAVPANNTSGDNLATAANLGAILEILKLFPEVASNSFHIVGESYAG